MSTTRAIKWRTIVGLILLGAAVVLDWAWVWGLLFLSWVMPDLFTGCTYFIEEIRRDETPILFWIIVVAWIVLSLYYFSSLLYLI